MARECFIKGCPGRAFMRVLYSEDAYTSSPRAEVIVCHHHYNEFMDLKRSKEVYIINNTYIGDGHY